MPVGAEEDIARAICSDKWDPETGELSPSLFKGTETSLSRLAITPLEHTWDLFRRHVEKPPARKLDRIGTINVGRLCEIGEAYKNGPTNLTVEPDPKEGYGSHAIIPQKITRGLANQILKDLIVHAEN
jgi:hypothetical protein